MVRASDIIVRNLVANTEYHIHLRKWLEPRGSPELQAQEIKRFCVSQLGNEYRLNKMERSLIDELLTNASWMRVRVLLKRALRNPQELQKIRPTEKLIRPVEEIKRPTEKIIRPTEELKKPTEKIIRPVEEIKKPAEKVEHSSEDDQEETPKGVIYL